MRTQLRMARTFGTTVIPCIANTKFYDMSAIRSRGYRTLNDLKQRGAKVPDMAYWWPTVAIGTRKKEEVAVRNTALVTNDHLLVIDFDSEDSYYRFRNEYSFATTTVKSPRGYHCYFNVTESIPQNIISTWANVELKFGGDCILCPPSKIGDHTYEFIENGILTISSVDILPMIGRRESQNSNGNSSAFSFRAPIDTGAPLPKKLYMGVIKDIKQRITVLEIAQRYTTMIDKGSYHIGCCPAHNDTHPSFRVAKDRAVCAVQDCKLNDKQALDTIELHQRINNISQRESLYILASELGLINAKNGT